MNFENQAEYIAFRKGSIELAEAFVAAFSQETWRYFKYTLNVVGKVTDNVTEHVETRGKKKLSHFTLNEFQHLGIAANDERLKDFNKLPDLILQLVDWYGKYWKRQIKKGGKE